ncbi:hypothetical protein NECID01_1633 [Nematocida sp. AWRm77]|nr:hypothetical protein NECID01_1633 [Nematocida sp. AWRm77]
MSVETRKLSIKKSAVGRLEKDVEVYEKELLSLEEEKKDMAEKGVDASTMKHLEERIRETEHALESTVHILKKMQGEMLLLSKEEGLL